MITSDNFKNAPIHDKKAILEMLDELEPKEMVELVRWLNHEQETLSMKMNACDCKKNLVEKQFYKD